MIRPARAEDIPRLEWFGMLTPFRQILEQDFDRSCRGELIYLVAEMNRFPVGQVEVDLTRFHPQATGYLMALRVMPPVQRLGIGRALLAAAEEAAVSRGMQLMRLNVAQDNEPALKLYRQLGYGIIGSEDDPWQYKTPHGEIRTIHELEWVMQKKLAPS